MKRILLICFVLMSSLISEAWAQKTVSGMVSSGTDGEGLPGVSVRVQGTSTGVTTDLDGNYRLQVPEDANTLVFSFVGFLTEEVVVGNRSVIDVTLQEDIQQLQEVVVTAFGLEKEKRSVGYAVSTVDGDEFVKAREANIANALAGKVAGVQVTSSSGQVGSSTRVVIRGNASINGNNQPLYVIDGVPISNSNIASVDRFSGVDYGNRVGDINPDDVASMSVLKGPAATALYGQRAANGAVIITTKKGKLNQKTSVTVNSSVRFDNPFRLPDYQNVYGQGTMHKLDSAGTSSWGPKMDGRIFTNANGEEVAYKAHPDNVENFYQTGSTIMNSVSLQGGEENSTFRFGLTNMQQEGIVPNTNMERYNVNLNASRKFKNNFYSSFGVNYVRSRNDGRPEVGFNNPNAVASQISTLPRNIDIEKLRDYETETGDQIKFLGINQNPYWSLYKNVFTQDLDRFYGYGQIGFKPLDWIDISWKLGGDIYHDSRKQKTAPGSVGDPKGEFWTDRIFESQINSDFFITLNRDITPDLNMSLLLGHNVNEVKTERSFNRAQELVDPGLFIADNALVNSPSEEVLNHTRLIGAFFDMGLSYQNYLFLNVTGRNDWNSTLPKENQSFFYPGVSASAVLTDAFNIDSDILSFAKMRASWGQVGSGTDPFLLQFTYFPQTDIFQLFGVDNTYPFRGIPGFQGTRVIPNAMLRPEITESWEVGTEMQFFRGKVLVDATFYNAETRDQIVRVDLPGSTGYVSALLNAGTVRNRGVELLVETTPFTSGDFNWKTTATFAKNNNELIEIPEEFSFIDIEGTRTDPGLRAIPGKPLGTIIGSAWRRDSDGNILINPATGLRMDQDNQEIGNITPDFRAGLQNELSWKGLIFSFLVDWSQGGNIHSQTVGDLFATGVVKETAKRDVAYIDKGVVLLEEDEEGNATSTRPNDIPVTYQQWWAQIDDVDETGIYDATYVKLREARFAYRLPRSLTSRTPFGNVEVGFEGRNLFLLYSAIPYIDPEVSFYGPTNAQGIEAFNLPTTRSYGFNVKLTF